LASVCLPERKEISGEAEKNNKGASISIPEKGKEAHEED